MRIDPDTPLPEVARAVGDEVDLEAFSSWAEAEGASEKYEEFVRRLG